MLLEDLFGLPTGTRLFGDIGVAINVGGVIDSLEDGSHFIRWEDGFVTAPLGRVRDADEYIAAHTRLAPACSFLAVCDIEVSLADRQVNESDVWANRKSKPDRVTGGRKLCQAPKLRPSLRSGSPRIDPVCEVERKGSSRKPAQAILASVEQGEIRPRVAAATRPSRSIATLASFLPQLRQAFALLRHLGFASALHSIDFLSSGVAGDLQQQLCSDCAKKGERKCSRPM
jgi:hypothetical protein